MPSKSLKGPHEQRFYIETHACVVFQPNPLGRIYPKFQSHYHRRLQRDRRSSSVITGPSEERFCATGNNDSKTGYSQVLSHLPTWLPEITTNYELYCVMSTVAICAIATTCHHLPPGGDDEYKGVRFRSCSSAICCSALSDTHGLADKPKLWVQLRGFEVHHIRPKTACLY